MAENFFQEPPQEAPNEPEKLKIGEKEYSQDDITRLVGLGEIADEVQTKTNRPIDKLWTQVNEEHKQLLDLQKKVGDFEKFQSRLTGVEDQVTPEQLKEQALKQADELGLLSKEQANQMIQEQVLAHIQAKDLLNEINTLNTEAETAGKPKADPQKLLEYMEETGFKSPTKAYKDMYENELRDWEAKKITEIKPEGFTTQEASTAGAKQPEQTRPANEDQLRQSLKNFFKAEGGSEST